MNVDEIVKQLRYLGDHGSYEPDMHHVAADRIETLEAKLAKAVKALDKIAGKATYADDPYDIARAALAELKRDKP